MPLLLSRENSDDVLSRLLTNLSKEELDVLIEIDAVTLISKMKHQTSLLLEILKDKRSHASFLKCGGVERREQVSSHGALAKNVEFETGA